MVYAATLGRLLSFSCCIENLKNAKLILWKVFFVEEKQNLFITILNLFCSLLFRLTFERDPTAKSNLLALLIEWCKSMLYFSYSYRFYCSILRFSPDPDSMMNEHRFRFTNSPANTNLNAANIPQFFNPAAISLPFCYSGTQINYRDSSWLKLSVCELFLKDECPNGDNCSLAHPPSTVKIENSTVTVCYDYIKVIITIFESHQNTFDYISQIFILNLNRCLSIDGEIRRNYHLDFHWLFEISNFFVVEERLQTRKL